MRKIALSEAQDDLSTVLRMADRGEIVITRHGKPAGVLIGFKSEEDWFDYRLENDPRFLARVVSARRSSPGSVYSSPARSCISRTCSVEKPSIRR